MYRAEHTRGDGNTDSANEGEIRSMWTSLEPEILYKIAERLSRRDVGSMRLTCTTWQQSVSSGVPSLSITKKVFKGQLKDLPQKFPGLKHLDLSNYAWLTDTEMKGLQKLPRLQDFEVVFGHELNDEGIEQMSHMTGIQRLKLIHFVRLHDQNIGMLKGLSGLVELTIQGAPRVTDEGLACLRHMSGLQRLALNYAPHVSDAGLENLAALPRLEDLSLLGCKSITGSGLSSLQELKGLSRVILARTEVTDKGLESLRMLTSLRRLSLAHCHRITDSTLCVLDALPLEWLDLTKCSLLTGQGSSLLNKMDGWVDFVGTAPSNYMQFLVDNIRTTRREEIECSQQTATA